MYEIRGKHESHDSITACRWYIVGLDDFDKQLLDGVRFARVLKDENPEKPNVAWMIFYEDKKNRNQFNKVELFIDKALKSLAIEK